jgi:hypothetical protein
VASWDDVRRIALALPQVVEQDGRMLSWRIKGKLVVWERPLRAGDLAALGDAAPKGEILGARIPDVGERQALIAEQPDVYFTIPHFDNYSAVLARLDAIAENDLAELIEQAWLVQAPKRLARRYLAERSGG